KLTAPRACVKCWYCAMAWSTSPAGRVRRMRACLLLLVLPLCWGAFVPNAPAADPAPAAIARLIEQLGSPEFTEREKATAELEALGQPVVAALRQAAEGTDPEIRRRAETLVHRLESQALTRKVLAPTQVRLVYHNTPLLKAVDDLQLRTGIHFELHDPEA